MTIKANEKGRSCWEEPATPSNCTRGDKRNEVRGRVGRGLAVFASITAIEENRKAIRQAEDIRYFRDPSKCGGRY